MLWDAEGYCGILKKDIGLTISCCRKLKKKKCLGWLSHAVENWTGIYCFKTVVKVVSCYTVLLNESLVGFCLFVCLFYFVFVCLDLCVCVCVCDYFISWKTKDWHILHFLRLTVLCNKVSFRKPFLLTVLCCKGSFIFSYSFFYYYSFQGEGE